MKIPLFISALSGGGAERVTCNLANHLAGFGHEVEVLTMSEAEAAEPLHQGVKHAFQCYAKMPYENKVAVIGRGNTARGAIKILNMLGADITQFERRTEELLHREIIDFQGR